jgi:hypothetical protein
MALHGISEVVDPEAATMILDAGIDPEVDSEAATLILM